MNRIREKTKWSLQVYQNAKQIEDLDILLEISSTWITAIVMDGHGFFKNFVCLSSPLKIARPKNKKQNIYKQKVK